MTGDFANASAIGVNLIYTLKERLRGTGCRPLGPNAGVETINKAVRYPDALVTCAKFQARGIESSLAAVTVLSRGGAADPWTHTGLNNDDILQMPEIGIEIPVAAFYEDITFDDQEDTAA